MPLVATSTSFTGTPIALGLSFFDNGHDMGLIMIRVLRGEDPANIPCQVGERRIMVVDLDAARAYGVTIPDAIVARADSVIGGRGATGLSGQAATAVAAQAPRPDKPARLLAAGGDAGTGLRRARVGSLSVVPYPSIRRPHPGRKLSTRSRSSRVAHRFGT